MVTTNENHPSPGRNSRVKRYTPRSLTNVMSAARSRMMRPALIETREKSSTSLSAFSSAGTRSTGIFIRAPSACRIAAQIEPGGSMSNEIIEVEIVPGKEVDLQLIATIAEYQRLRLDKKRIKLVLEIAPIPRDE